MLGVNCVGFFVDGPFINGIWTRMIDHFAVEMRKEEDFISNNIIDRIIRSFWKIVLEFREFT